MKILKTIFSKIKIYDYIFFAFLISVCVYGYRNPNNGSQIILNLVTEVIGIYFSVRIINGLIERGNKKDRVRNFFIRELQRIDKFLKVPSVSANTNIINEEEKNFGLLKVKFDQNESFFFKDEQKQMYQILMRLEDLFKIQRSRFENESYLRDISLNWTNLSYDLNELRKDKIKILKNLLPLNAEKKDDVLKILGELKNLTGTWEQVYFNSLITNIQNNNFGYLVFPNQLEQGSFAIGNIMVDARIQSSINLFNGNLLYDKNEVLIENLTKELGKIEADSGLLPEIKHLRISNIHKLIEKIRLRMDFISKSKDIGELLEKFSNNIFEETERNN